MLLIFNSSFISGAAVTIGSVMKTNYQIVVIVEWLCIIKIVLVNLSFLAVPQLMQPILDKFKKNVTANIRSSLRRISSRKSNLSSTVCNDAKEPSQVSHEVHEVHDVFDEDDSDDDDDDNYDENNADVSVGHENRPATTAGPENKN